MRVLQVIDSLDTGGAERSLVAMAKDLVELGVDLHVATVVARHDLLGELQRLPVTIHKPIGGRNRLMSMRAAQHLIRHLKPDLVHATLYEATLACTVPSAVERCPMLVSLVSEEFGAEHYATPTMRRSRVCAAHLTAVANAQLVRHFHAVSATVKDSMSRRLLVPRSRITVVPRGRDPLQLGERTDERRRRARAMLELDDRERVVLCVARHDYAKGIDLAIEALHGLEISAPITLLVAGGTGSMTESLERRARELSKTTQSTRVRFLGVRSDIPDLLAATDVFCFPSRREGSPGALMEAMALEAPIVASDIPPIREVLGEHSGLVRNPTPASLAAALKTALSRTPDSEPTRLRQRFLDEFTLHSSSAAMHDLYLAVASGR